MLSRAWFLAVVRPIIELDNGHHVKGPRVDHKKVYDFPIEAAAHATGEAADAPEEPRAIEGANGVILLERSWPRLARQVSSP